MAKILSATPEIKKSPTNLDNSQLIVHPASFETVIPYQPSVTNYEGKADRVIMMHYNRLPAHEVAEHCVKEYDLLVIIDINSTTELECRLHGKLYPRKKIGNGTIGIFPDGISHWAVWNSEMAITTFFIQKEFINQLGQRHTKNDTVELRPFCDHVDSQIYHLGMALKEELATPLGSSTGLLYRDTLINALALRLIGGCSSARVIEPKYEQSLPTSTFKLLIDYIDAHLHQDIRLADLAALVNFSEAYISILFKRFTGIPIHQYIIKQRIKRATPLLKSSQLSITEIALECGFYSHSHFTRLFKRTVGVNPSQVRQGKLI